MMASRLNIYFMTRKKNLEKPKRLMRKFTKTMFEIMVKYFLSLKKKMRG